MSVSCPNRAGHADRQSVLEAGQHRVGEARGVVDELPGEVGTALRGEMDGVTAVTITPPVTERLDLEELDPGVVRHGLRRALAPQVVVAACLVEVRLVRGRVGKLEGDDRRAGLLEADGKRDGEGKSGSVRVEIGGGRI